MAKASEDKVREALLKVRQEISNLKKKVKEAKKKVTQAEVHVDEIIREVEAKWEDELRGIKNRAIKEFHSSAELQEEG